MNLTVIGSSTVEIDAGLRIGVFRCVHDPVRRFHSQRQPFGSRCGVNQPVRLAQFTHQVVRFSDDLERRARAVRVANFKPRPIRNRLKGEVALPGAGHVGQRYDQ